MVMQYSRRTPQWMIDEVARVAVNIGAPVRYRDRGDIAAWRRALDLSSRLVLLEAIAAHCAPDIGPDVPGGGAV